MRTNRCVIGAALVGAVLLAGCGGSSSSSSDGSYALAASAKTPQGLTVTLTGNTAYTAPGGAVTYTRTLTNNTSLPITYQPVGSCSLDGIALQVTDATGAVVYPNPNSGSTGCNSGAVGSPVTLAPGASSSEPVTPVSAFATAGTYSVTATFQVTTPGTSAITSTKVGPLTVLVAAPVG